MRRVLSLWLPRFATDRWCLRHRPPARRCDAWQASASDGEPPLQTGGGAAAPLALIRAEQGRLLLTAVNAAGQAAGLGPGMPLADARAILPGLKTAEEAPAADARALAKLAEWCGRYTPWVAIDGAGREPGGGAGLLLDVTGCAHLFGGEAALAADLVRRLHHLGYAARCALAGTPGAAWGLARYASDAARPALVVPAADLHAALAPLPPAALRLAPGRCELLLRLGLTRIGDLYPIPRATLEPRFGPELARRLAQALGELPEPISPRLEAPPPLVRRVFAEPIATAEAIAQALERLLSELCRQLEAEQLGARRLELRLYRVDGTLRWLAIGTSRPNRDPAHLMRLFAEHLERIDPGFGIDVMTLAALRSEPLSALQLVLGVQPAAAGADGPADGLAQLIDRLSGRLGAASVIVLMPCESHIPERAVRAAPPLEAAQADRGWRAWRSAAGQAPRPLQLLPRPEPVEAMALLPDHPPVQFRWRRVRHRVIRAEGPERIGSEWWRDEGALSEPVPAAEARDYFRVEDEDGRRFWLYRRDGAWFLHGLFG